MKKLFLSAACALTLFAVACSSSPEKQVENLLDKYTTKIEKAKSGEDLEKIFGSFMEEAMKFDEKHPDFSVEDNKQLQEKMADLYEAFEDKAEELGANFGSDLF